MKIFEVNLNKIFEELDTLQLPSEKKFLLGKMCLYNLKTPMQFP